jgi:hypothetical protein
MSDSIRRRREFHVEAADLESRALLSGGRVAPAIIDPLPASLARMAAAQRTPALQLADRIERRNERLAEIRSSRKPPLQGDQRFDQDALRTLGHLQPDLASHDGLVDEQDVRKFGKDVKSLGNQLKRFGDEVARAFREVF